ncbi:MAG: class I SAM-dependent methyltransferase [Armatimonadetes bacterium]|nr:class I SAM-dependent methyltransferase [Armatimonadota bacterium]
MTYFSHDTAARRYAQARPYFHPLVIGLVRDHLGLREPMSRALDVACGTGRSALALTEIARQVVATDVSGAMLSEAVRDPLVVYLQADAEALPLADGAFDLITVALAFHWLDRARFLAEARRLLRPSGWLVIYNNAFAGVMRENPEFADWSRDVYLARYPSPIRQGHPVSAPEAERYGFRLAHRKDYVNDVSFSPEALARYLMTQSNVIAAVEQGAERPDAVYAWLLRELRSLFLGPTATFEFGGYIWYLQGVERRDHALFQDVRS